MSRHLGLTVYMPGTYALKIRGEPESTIKELIEEEKESMNN